MASEIEVVEASQTTPIRVGIVNDSAPLFYEQNGEYQGIVIDVLNLISEKTGLQFTYYIADMSRRDEVSTSTDIAQMIIGATKMDSLVDERGWYLSDAVITDSLVLVSKSGNDITQTPSDTTIAYVTGFEVSTDYLGVYLPEYKTKGYDTLGDCLNAVEEGEADAAIYIRSSISYLLQNPHYENFEIVSAYSGNIDIVAAAFVVNNEVLIDIVNKGLVMLTAEETNSIILNCTLLHPYTLSVGETLYKFRVAIIIIVLSFAAVIISVSLMYIIKRRSEKAVLVAYEKEKEALVLAEQASAAKGSFMSRMSHEIRTPLNAIIGYNTIASNDITEAKTDAEYRAAVMKVADCLTKSNTASKHLLTIINDVLDMSAIESGKIQIAHERFDFKGLINSITTIFYPQAKGKGVDLQVVFNAMTEEWFIGDQMRISQILTNIVSNAIKFTPDGGKVKILINQESQDENFAQVHFEVEDTGIGMTEEYLTHIFTPFEQADASISRRFGGTGLGLSITKSLVELMGGTITVSSQLGKGSKFCVDLTFGRTTQPSSSASYDFSNINALIADDDISTCDYIKLLMERFGARCSAVNSGFEAVDAVSIAHEKGEPYSMCLVDWRMPKMDGLETVKRIRKIVGNDMPIVVITAYDFSDIVDKAAEAGITKFISKPLFQSSLFNLLADVCGMKQEVAAVNKQEIDFKGQRILLTEDNAMNMEIALNLLVSAGLVVDTAWNGKEAVDTFEAMPKGTYKAILMDVQMPVMDGHEATRTIRNSKHPDAKSIPIIAMTADAFAENVAEALACGMNEHIAKPIDVPVLLEKLSNFID